MITDRTSLTALVLACLLLGSSVAHGEDPEATPEERQEYLREYERVDSMRAYLSLDREYGLAAYEAFADDVDETWRGRNREYYGRLMLVVCRPLSSGTFTDRRRYELARKYALSVLEEADRIPLTLELELTGHVVTVRIGPDAYRGENFAEIRREDVTVRLHAWKRLIEAIDPNWDPDEVIWGGNVMPPVATGLSPGVDPAAIEDADLRAEYEANILDNRQKAEEYQEQYDLHRWLRKFPKRAEGDIIQAYSFPPFDIEALRVLLDENLPDQDARDRIIEAVDRIKRETQRGEQ